MLFIKIIHSPIGDLCLKQHNALESKAVSVITQSSVVKYREWSICNVRQLKCLLDLFKWHGQSSVVPLERWAREREHQINQQCPQNPEKQWYDKNIQMVTGEVAP